MMKTIKGYFYINTGFINSQKREDFEIEVDDNDSEEAITMVLQDQFEGFLSNTDMGWVINEN